MSKWIKNIGKKPVALEVSLRFDGNIELPDELENESPDDWFWEKYEGHGFIKEYMITKHIQ